MKAFRVRRALGSIRTKFLLYYIAALSVILIFAAAITYNIVYDVIQNINHRNAQSEIGQISSNLTGLYGDITRQTDEIIYSDYIKILCDPGNQTPYNLIYAINDYRKAALNIIRNFPYVQSVYAFLPGDYVLCATKENMQRFQKFDPQLYPVLCEKVLAQENRSVSLVGGLTPGDFPFLYPIKSDNTLLLNRRLVSAVRNLNGYRLVINLYEEHFQLAYIGISNKPSHTVRILNTDGYILSSLKPSELGMPYERLDIISGTASGQFASSASQSQIVWTTSPSQDVIVISEVLLQEYWNDLNRITRTLLFVIASGFIITCAAFYLWLGKTFRPFTALRQSMQRAGTGLYDEPLPVNGFDELSIHIESYNEMLYCLRRLTEQVEQIQAEKLASELKALRSQINPHFLFNTLSSIKWMCQMGETASASKCITALSGILSPMFKSSSTTCKLDEELASVKLYIEIMNVRQGGGIIYEQDIEEGLLSAVVLRFILQPLAENAVTHGFLPGSGAGCINLRAWSSNGDLIICISDDGIGLSPEETDKLNERLNLNLDTDGVGLTNTNRRLKLQYGDSYGVRTEKTGERGLAAILSLPLIFDAESQ